MKVEIEGEFIKVGQLIKKINIIDTGGQAKYFLETHEVEVEGKDEVKRNTKLYPGSKVWIDGEVYYIISKQ